MPTCLLVEDSPSLARAYMEYLRDEPYDVVLAETGNEALDFLATHRPQMMLLDIKLPDMDGLTILRRIREQQLQTAVVVITAHASVNMAVEAMRGGADDFLVKPFNADRLIYTTRNAMERQRLARIVERYEEDIVRSTYAGFIGGSLPMQAVYRIIDSAAQSKATVFITGDSGTGKELCAEAIHRRSPRTAGPLVAINCAAIPRELIESEIFGHVRGAFTGAVEERDGAAARASGGTLFLDEICEMDVNLQSKLLRFVQTGSFNKVGGTKLEKVDVRFICATNQDPLQAVDEGRFREDLYYRLHVIPVHLPPLAERGDDVLEIAAEFLQRIAKEEGKHFQRLAPVTETIFLAYAWPGNVRQLENVIRNIVVLHDGVEVTPDMLPPPLPRNSAGLPRRPVATSRSIPSNRAPVTASATIGDGEVRPLADVERDAIERAIAACDGNIPKAAALLDISASTIYRKRLNWKTGE
ncbi:MAG: sigma-54 dependent transcriptional regulator [Alphaproteobacteria bacterium]